LRGGLLFSQVGAYLQTAMYVHCQSTQFLSLVLKCRPHMHWYCVRIAYSTSAVAHSAAESIRESVMLFAELETFKLLHHTPRPK
jgi:hypothetical protein